MNSIQTSVVNTLRATTPAGARLYALIDLANCQRHVNDTLRTLKSHSGACVLGELCDEAERASPWLVEIPLHDSTSRLIDWSVGVAHGSPCTSWLSSTLGLPGLRTMLRARTDAQLPDTHDVLLRYFDPRILPALYNLLGPAHPSGFFAIGQSWQYLDREHELQTLALLSPADPDPFMSPLQLSSAQFDELLASSEIDSVVPELMREAPAEFAALKPTTRIRFTQQWLARANEWGIDQFPDRVILCVLALKLGEGFYQQPEWKDALTTMKQRGQRLSQVIAHVLHEQETSDA